MMSHRFVRLARRPRHARQRGAQALEYIGLCSAVGTMVGGAIVYAHGHGAEFGGMLFNQIHNVLGQ